MEGNGHEEITESGKERLSAECINRGSPVLQVSSCGRWVPLNPVWSEINGPLKLSKKALYMMSKLSAAVIWTHGNPCNVIQLTSCEIECLERNWVIVAKSLANLNCQHHPLLLIVTRHKKISVKIIIKRHSQINVILNWIRRNFISSKVAMVLLQPQTFN